MSETPKKVTNVSEKCFLCSENKTSTNNRLFVSGKSALDIADLIKISVNVDVNNYSESNDLFVCKNICYKRLLRLKGALDKLEKIKEEIRERFVPVRTKRLLRPEDKRQEDATQDECMRVQQPRQPRCKASKSIQFPDTGPGNANLVACVTSLGETYQDIEQSLPLSVNTSTQRLSDAAPPIYPVPTSLPAPLTSSSPVVTTAKSASSGCVKITVNYPSRTVSKTLDDTYDTLGKALLYGPPSRVATAVMKCDPVRKVVIQKVLGIVSKEVSDLCSRKKPSMLRKTGKDDLMKFSLEQLCDEWEKRAPIFYLFLVASSITKTTKNKSWLPSVAVSGSVLLKQRNGDMSATAYVLGILLKSRSTEVSVLIHLKYYIDLILVFILGFTKKICCKAKVPAGFTSSLTFMVSKVLGFYAYRIAKFTSNVAIF
jgi:hypothetical protein